MPEFKYDECEYRMCIYCFSVHKYYRFTDAAGSRDWNYKKVDK